MVAGLSGCADEVTDINRVQPHYVKKADLDGQWFYRQTVVDMPPEYGIAFSGIECGLQKIRFEVREDALIAYRTHEAIPGLEADETAEGASFRGDPVAAFPITSHFDIVRDYNRQNGEQSNVLVEDTSTRPWYERDYMRVDWQVVGRVSASVPALPSAVDCSGIVLVNYVGRGGEGYGQYVRDTDKFNPDHLRIDHDHIFFTQTANVTDGGYACWADHGYSNSIYGSPCGSVEAKVRHAFARIDAEAEAQFEPVSHLDSELMNEAAEPFTDANANGRYEQGEAFQDQNGNGKWDGQRRIKVRHRERRPRPRLHGGRRLHPEVLDALRGEVTAEDCRDLQWHHDGRFGFFRSSERPTTARSAAATTTTASTSPATHQIWKRTRDDAGNPCPRPSASSSRWSTTSTPGFPEDLKTTAVQLGRDWNEVFMEAAVAGTGKTRSAIEAQLKGDFDDEAEIAVWMKGDDGQTFGPEALFQVRDNTCSVPGVEAYLKRFPS
ncbi:MAG: hypothetical protein R3F43_18225 [bacterium]